LAGGERATRRPDRFLGFWLLRLDVYYVVTRGLGRPDRLLVDRCVRVDHLCILGGNGAEEVVFVGVAELGTTVIAPGGVKVVGRAAVGTCPSPLLIFNVLRVRQLILPYVCPSS
jgi:hypothetical protein